MVSRRPTARTLMRWARSYSPVRLPASQHWLDDDDERASDDDYEEVVCTACPRVHFVNRKGKVLGGDED
jgi:hypothetical protein